jgi:hypothetical protein
MRWCVCYARGGCLECFCVFPPTPSGADSPPSPSPHGRSGATRVLIATDVWGRGLDVQQVRVYVMRSHHAARPACVYERPRLPTPIPP